VDPMQIVHRFHKSEINCQPSEEIAGVFLFGKNRESLAPLF
jgi:hypothetical protein